jgi:ADP-dependent NAD(P)H-hydrate dehydratase / NAD(P)H-hydrate epimerase
MKLYTSRDIKIAEEYAINELKVPSILLMEHAARGVYEEILKVFPKPQKYNFLILYGEGNNGGDALCLARMLALKSCKIKIVEVLGPPKTSDSKLQMKFLKETIKKKNHDGGDFSEVKFLNPSDALACINEKTIVIDGVFGTGFDKREKTELSNKVIGLFAKLKNANYVFSIDIPSGLDANTGELAKWAIHADCTVSFIYPKIGLFVAPGALNTGKVKIKSLLFPKGPSLETQYELITPKLVRSFLNPLKRKTDSHKGTYGHVAIIAPQKGMEGAATMVALAALRSGAGLTTILGLDEDEENLRRRMRDLIPEAIIAKVDTLKTSSVAKQFEKFDCVVVGPGFGIKNKDKLKKIIKVIDKPLVLDADALNIISADLELFNIIKTKTNVILTPHPGEMNRLFSSFVDIQNQRLNVLEGFLEQHSPNCPCIILKGYRSMLGLLQDPENKQNKQKNMQDGGKQKYKIFINTTGGPALSKGGSGDVLSGMIAAFCAQGLKIWQAGILAIFLHGLCADVLVEKKETEFDILPTDLIDEISRGIKCLIS